MKDKVRPVQLPSAAMREVNKKVERFAEADVPVLITGETGVGKEIIAREIHRTSPRNDKPFIAVNCSTFPDNGLLESQIFGHEKGAFTDATYQRKGDFERADTGTLFFDEIGDMHIEAQPKFLRVLENQTFTRLGGTQTIRTDVRIVAATNKDIKALVAAKKFREDLYYRLALFEIHIPPLRERREDILPLVDAFLSEFSVKYGKRVMKISPEVLDFFINSAWPGNIRELKLILEKMVILTTTNELTFSNLPSDSAIVRQVEDQVEDFERLSDSGTDSDISAVVRQVLTLLSVEEFVLIFGGVPKSVWRELPGKVQRRVIGEASAYLSELLGGQADVIRIGEMNREQILGLAARQRIAKHETLKTAAASLGIDSRTLSSYAKGADTRE